MTMPLESPRYSPRPESPLTMPVSDRPKEGTPHPSQWVRMPYQHRSEQEQRRRRSDVLGLIFPATRHALGEDRYQDLARDYIGSHRHDYAQITDLAVGFPEYLRLDVASLSHRKFLVQLAALEYTIHATASKAQLYQTARRPETALAPGQNLNQLHLDLNRDAQLLQFEYQVNDYRSTVEKLMAEGSTDVVGAPGKPVTTWLAVYHRAGDAWRMPLGQEQFELLRALSRGRTLGDVMRYAGSDSDDQINLWVSRWLAEGLLIAA